MPKVGKIGFTGTGEVFDKFHSRNGKEIELELHYKLRDDVFYFLEEDIEGNLSGEKIKSYGGIPDVFKECRTKEDACIILGRLFSPDGEVKKHLSIEIEVSTNSFIKVNDEKKLTTLARKMINNFYSYRTNKKEGVILDYKRYVSITNRFGTAYCECSEYGEDKWGYNNRDFKSQKPKGLIDWTEDREQFIVNTNNQLHELANNIVRFFNIESKDIDEIMTPTNRLLGTK